METQTRESTGDLLERIAALEERESQLQRALDSRIVIEQAKGAVSARNDVTPAEAFALIRAGARRQRRALHAFCAEVVENRGRLENDV